jgi:hypothetical protein
MSGAEGREGEIEIQINRQTFRIERRPLSGADLRRLPTPPLGNEVDIFQVSKLSGAPDVPVADHQLVDLDNGTVFFSAPRHVLPGMRTRTLSFLDVFLRIRSMVHNLTHYEEAGFNRMGVARQHRLDAVDLQSRPDRHR